MSEETLSARLLSDKSKRPSILSDCERVIADEVDAKSGLTGIAIKAGYTVVRKVKPGIIREVMDSLLDDFVKRLEPLYRRHVEGGGAPDAFPAFMKGRASEVADALLGITDDRARVAKNRTLVSAYEKLRPQGKKHVEEGVPRIASMLAKHLK